MFLIVNVQMLHICDNYQLILCIRLLLIVDYDFLSDYPSLIHRIRIHYVQHFQTMLLRRVNELIHFSLHDVSSELNFLKQKLNFWYKMHLMDGWTGFLHFFDFIWKKMYLFLFYEIHWNKCIILYPMVFTFASKAKCVISNVKTFDWDFDRDRYLLYF